MMRALGLGVAVLATMLLSVRSNHAQRRADRQNLVLITLDGARTEEIFGGLDLAVLQSTMRDKQTRGRSAASTSASGRRTPQARREKLMPFFWKTLMAGHGSIAGNRALGSVVQLTNTHRFSYPGYSEILTGEAHDDVINSNDGEAQSLPDRARGAARAPQAAGARRGHVRLMGRVHLHRRAHRRRDVHQRRVPAVHHRRCRGEADERSADGWRRPPGIRCGTTTTPIASPCRIWRPSGRACCISRMARPTTGRTTAATIAC